MISCQCEAFEGMLAPLAKTPVASEKQTKTSASASRILFFFSPLPGLMAPMILPWRLVFSSAELSMRHCEMTGARTTFSRGRLRLMGKKRFGCIIH